MAASSWDSYISSLGRYRPGASRSSGSSYSSRNPLLEYERRLMRNVTPDLSQVESGPGLGGRIFNGVLTALDFARAGVYAGVLRPLAEDLGVVEDDGTDLVETWRRSIAEDEGVGDLLYEAFDIDEESSLWARVPVSTVGFLGDVFTDPTTYLTLGTGTVGRLALREVAEAGARQVTGDMSREVLERAGRERLALLLRDVPEEQFAKMTDDELVNALANRQIVLRGDDPAADMVRRSGVPDGDEIFDEFGEVIGYQAADDAVKIVDSDLADALQFENYDEMIKQLAQQNVADLFLASRAAGTGSTVARVFGDAMQRWGSNTDEAFRIFRKADPELRGGLGLRAPIGGRTLSLTQGGARVLKRPDTYGFMERGADILNARRLKIRAAAAPALSRVRGRLGTQYATFLKELDGAVRGGGKVGARIASKLGDDVLMDTARQFIAYDYALGAGMRTLRAAADRLGPTRRRLNQSLTGFRTAGVAVEGVTAAAVREDEQTLLDIVNRGLLKRGVDPAKLKPEEERLAEAAARNIQALNERYGREVVNDLYRAYEAHNAGMLELLAEYGLPVQSLQVGFENRVASQEFIAWEQARGNKRFGASSAVKGRTAFAAEDLGVMTPIYKAEAGSVGAQVYDLGRTADGKWLPVGEINRRMRAANSDIDFDVFVEDPVEALEQVIARSTHVVARKNQWDAFVKANPGLVPNPQQYKTLSDFERKELLGKVSGYLSVSGRPLTREVMGVFEQQVVGLSEHSDAVRDLIRSLPGFADLPNVSGVDPVEAYAADFAKRTSSEVMGAAGSLFKQDELDEIFDLVAAVSRGDRSALDRAIFAESAEEQSDSLVYRLFKGADRDAAISSLLRDAPKIMDGDEAARMDAVALLLSGHANRALNSLREVGEYFRSAPFGPELAAATDAVADEFVRGLPTVPGLARAIASNLNLPPIVGNLEFATADTLDDVVRFFEDASDRVLTERLQRAAADGTLPAARASELEDLIARSGRFQISGAERLSLLQSIPEVSNNLIDFSDFNDIQRAQTAVVRLRNLISEREEVRGLIESKFQAVDFAERENIALPAALRGVERAKWFGSDGMRETIRNMFEMSNKSEKVMPVLRVYENVALTLFKNYATVGNTSLSYHFNNFIGGVSNNLAGGVTATQAREGFAVGRIVADTLDGMQEAFENFNPAKVEKLSDRVREELFRQAKMAAEKSDFEFSFNTYLHLGGIEEEPSATIARLVVDMYDEGMLQTQTRHLMGENAALSSIAAGKSASTDFEAEVVREYRLRATAQNASEELREESIRLSKWLKARDDFAIDPSDANRQAFEAVESFGPRKADVMSARVRYGKATQNKALQASGRVAERIEHGLRFAAVLRGYQRFGCPEGGAMFAKALHFDYDNLSQFERNTMKRILPFYVWMRNNIPLQTRLIINRPGRLENIVSLRDAMAEAIGDPGIDEGALPDWAESKMGFFAKLPFTTGRKVVFRLNSPSIDLIEWLRDPSEGVMAVAGGIAPAPKSANQLAQLAGLPSFDLGYQTKSVGDLRPGESKFDHVLSTLFFGASKDEDEAMSDYVANVLSGDFKKSVVGSSFSPIASTLNRVYSLSQIPAEQAGVELPGDNKDWKVTLASLLGAPISEVSDKSLEYSVRQLDNERREALNEIIRQETGIVDVTAEDRRQWAIRTGNIFDYLPSDPSLSGLDKTKDKRLQMFGLK
jgi:hypothetical protein